MRGHRRRALAAYQAILEVARAQHKHNEVAHISRLVSDICEQIGDLATGEDCLLRALAPLDAPNPPVAVKALLWSVAHRLAEFYLGTLGPVQRKNARGGDTAFVRSARLTRPHLRLCSIAAPAFQAYEACVSFLERAVLRDTLPANKLGPFCWLLADAYLHKGWTGDALAVLGLFDLSAVGFNAGALSPSLGSANPVVEHLVRAGYGGGGHNAPKLAVDAYVPRASVRRLTPSARSR